MDLEDMYLNIPTAQLPDAFQYLLQKIAATPYVRGRSRQAHLDWVSVFRIFEKLDVHGRAANRDAYSYVSVDLLRDYLLFELQGNNLFRAGSWVLAQYHGIPMAGKISDQLASLYLMTRGMIARDFFSSAPECFAPATEVISFFRTPLDLVTLICTLSRRPPALFMPSL